MKNKTRIIKIAAAGGGGAAVLVVIFVLVLDVWLPKKVASVVNAHFGEYVRVGEVGYAFPLAVRAEEVEIKKRPGSIMSANVRRVKCDVRVTALIFFRWDARLLKSLAAEDFDVYIYPIKMPRPRMSLARAATDVGLTQPTGPAIPLAAPVAKGSLIESPGAILKPSREGKSHNSKVINKYDISFRASNGRIILRGEREDHVVLKEVNAGGRLTADLITAAVSGRAGETGSFDVNVRYSQVEKVGSASYKIAAAPAVHVVTFMGKPTFLKEISGVVSFSGRVKWGNGELDHVATGRLDDGRLLLAVREFSFSLDDVTLQFTLHNADLSINEGSCAAATVRWTFGGRAGKLGLDITFRSENMTLTNLVGMVTGDVALTYGGVGIAELHLGGTLTRPELYLRVARTDVIRR